MTELMANDAATANDTFSTEAWLADRSWSHPTWTVAELVAAKNGRSISVVLPALNEEETVGSVVETISPLLGGLVDELIVLDSGSTDDTEICAISAGAHVVSREQALPEIAPRSGKGEVLWRSLAVATGDIIVFVDSDLIDPDPMFVPRLVGPLLLADGVHLVKGFYRRPLKVGKSEDANGGGRVTELVARPMLAALRPELGCVFAAVGWRIRRHPGIADCGSVRAGLRGGDRPPRRYLRQVWARRHRPGQLGRAGAPEPAADRSGCHEPAGHCDAALPVWGR
jgi:glycosyltransferase involved in cell wall biosynthesis